MLMINTVFVLIISFGAIRIRIMRTILKSVSTGTDRSY